MSNYNKAIGSTLGGAIGVILTFLIPWDRLGITPDDVPTVVGAVIVMLGAFATYLAPANKLV